MSFDGTPADRACQFLLFCDGAEDAGLPEYARRGRVVARDLLAAVDQLDLERSVMRTLQDRCETQQAILARHAYEAIR